jgi:hypothetical protein
VGEQRTGLLGDLVIGLLGGREARDRADSCVTGPGASATLSGSALKSVSRSAGVTLSNSGVSALYIVACWSI